MYLFKRVYHSENSCSLLLAIKYMHVIHLTVENKLACLNTAQSQGESAVTVKVSGPKSRTMKPKWISTPSLHQLEPPGPSPCPLHQCSTSGSQSYYTPDFFCFVSWDSLQIFHSPFKLKTATLLGTAEESPPACFPLPPQDWLIIPHS